MLRSAFLVGSVLAAVAWSLAAGNVHAQPASPPSTSSLQDTITRSLGPSPAPDTDHVLEETDGDIARWEQALEVFRLIGGRADLSQEQLAVIRTQIVDTKAVIEERRRQLDAQISQLHAQLDSLGPPPEDGLEPDAVLRRRGELTERIREVEGRHKEIGLLIELADQLVEQIGVARVAELRERLFTQYPTPLRPEVLLTGLRDGLDVLARIISAPLMDLSRGLERSLSALPPLITVTVIALAVWLASLFWLERRFGPHGEPTSYSRRVLAAIVVAISRGLAPAAVIAAPVFVIEQLAVTSGLATIVLVSAQEALVRFLLLTGLIRAALAPHNTPWRLPDIPDESVSVIWRRSLILLTTLHVALFLIEVAQNLNISPELRSGFALVFSVLIATNLLALLRRDYWEPQAQAADGEDESDDARTGIDPGTVIRWLLILVAVAGVAFALIGYSEAAIWLLSKLIDVSFLALALIMARGLVRDLGGIVDDPTTRAHRWVQRIAGASDAAITRTIFWFNILIDLATFAGAMLGIALIVGMSAGDLYLIVMRALEGFDVGSVRISPGSLLAGLVAFFVALVITRMIQRGLVRRIFPHTHIDSGVQHSVTAGIGYIGVTLALLTAVATVGFDLSNLALIAGALSVGIGFGLQAIVNNFVSGLILLAERPIKVGDWIKIGAFEGTVKRINVRATEIQTFQRSEVIIPNSELITSALINYTHKDKYGRIDVAVPVSYGEDPKKVGDILLDVASEHPMVATWPEPYLYFHGFDDVAMRLQLRVYLIDINNFLTVTNDLHFGVAERLRAAGIAFPRPHTDTRLRRDDVQDRMLGPVPADRDFDHQAPKGGEMDS
ncbi:mechanosensitive ion channel domain-containing protein [Thalassobaculum litoreum]|uniref:Small-conductance mechanosensitive channel n=1 Tax=Thalassobaculum litoreum DSM 18839 TaxID=1123362 RepID=A0A8G2BDY4_9PROT|nr:mechanosensitive ion channel domain-containing protein [Thalassobaculum litoreum]SDF09577.1 Small-conductance mechanosensitive channel [Thalassobaculum litoreum DSM 18839]